MSEWGYIGASYGVTWLTFAIYQLYLRARVARAEAAGDVSRETTR